nr:uncharacterized protein LOC112705214 [Arachis hypogaea]
MSFVELQNGFCNNIQSHILKRVSNLLYRSSMQVFGGLIQFQLMPITDDASMQQMFCIYQQTQFHVPKIELYVEFEQQSALDAVGKEVNVNELGDIHWKEDNNNSKEEFEANYKVDDENDDGDLAGNSKVQNEANAIVSQHLFGVLSFMRTLDLEAMHAPEFPKFANTGEGNVAVEDGEFSVRMEFGSRESVISAIKSYTISRGVDYTMYEAEPQTFYAKCKGVGTISQDHAKLDSDTIADAIRPLVESDPSLKVKSVIAEVQFRFNYTVSYRKALLAKQKAVAKVFGDWKVSYQTLPVWLKAMTVKMPRHCKPLVQVDGMHLYEKYKGAFLVAVAQDENQNIVPIAFVIVEGKPADAWEFFLTNLRRYVVTIDGVGIISDRHTSIDAAIARSNGAWSPPRAWHMYYIRHIGSNFLRRFKAPYFHKLVVNTGYSRTEQEYNKNYQRIKEQGESTEAYERLRNGFTYSKFATKRVEESFRRAGNIVVNRFDRRNEVFEVREMQDGIIYTVNLAQ